MAEFEQLPKDCIAAILSRTTPADACKLSIVSKTLRSAADSDNVWNYFLSSDSNFIASIISHSPSLVSIPTKKALYLALSHRPIIIDNALKCFRLDRKSGKKSYMLAARSLDINCGDEFDRDIDEENFNWTAMPESRFFEVAKFGIVSWFEIRGVINTLALSPNTHYAAYLVFKMTDAFGFRVSNKPVELSVGVKGGHSSTKVGYLKCKPQERIVQWYDILKHNKVERLQRPSVRSNGWLELEIGEFFNSGLQDEEVQMSVIDKKTRDLKRNLFFEGIEVRPKSDSSGFISSTRDEPEKTVICHWRPPRRRHRCTIKQH